MAHSIARSVPPMPAVGGGDAGPLSLDQTSRTEWDILMTRNDRWVTCASGITDPGELPQRLDFLRWGNPSGSVTFHVLERVITMHERLLSPEDLPPAPSADIDVSDSTPAATAAVSASAAAAAADNQGSAHARSPINEQ